MKSKYRELCRCESSIPLFLRDWWLDAVVGPDLWDVATVEKGGQLVAAMPYTVGKRLLFTMLGQPPLTQFLGPWTKTRATKSAHELRRSKDEFQELIEKLPPYDHYAQNWHFKQNNWLPFFWHDFRQTTRYTYRLNDLTSKAALWEQLQGNIRRDIKKAKERFHLKVRTDVGVAGFLRLNAMVFERQEKKRSYSDAVATRLDEACAARGARKIFFAEDEAGRLHAGVYIVWDENTAYYLMGGSDPNLRNSGATSLCLWEAIQFAATVTKSFDFEGSMIESVERFFRAFGAVQTPYFCVSKTPSRVLRAYLLAKELL